MTISVRSTCEFPASTALNIGAAPSITRAIHPLATAANHVLGSLLGGMRVCQRGAETQSGTGTLRYQLHRHPNCEAIDCHVKIQTWGGQANWEIAAQAGSGRAIELSDSLDIDSAEGAGEYRLRPPWADGDTGIREVTITTYEVSLKMLAINDVPRESLSISDGDHCIERVDSTYPAIGLMPERAIADSSEAGPPALVDQIVSAWDDYRPQLVAWSTWESDAPTFTNASFGGSGASSDIFAGHTVRLKGRAKTAAQTRDTADVKIYVTPSNAHTTGELKVTAINPGGGADDSDTVAIASGSAAWYDLEVEVDCTTEGRGVFECRRTGGIGTLKVSSVSVIGSKP